MQGLLPTFDVQHSPGGALAQCVGGAAHIVALVRLCHVLQRQRGHARGHVKRDVDARRGDDLLAVVVPCHLGRRLTLNLACQLKPGKQQS